MFHRTLFRRWSPVFASVLLAACEVPPSVGSTSEPIINGTLAPAFTGVVHIEHPLYSRFTCSGTVVAPTLVVTAKHCIFRQLEDTEDEPLPAAGFRVGFGADLEKLEFREVADRLWVGAPGELEVKASAEVGEDVAVLVLKTPVPMGTFIHPIDFTFHPYANDEYTLVGYGLSTITDAISGTKRSAVDKASAFDPATGILESSGDGACAGDSGGPFLFGDDAALVGVISQVGGSSDEAYCDVGKSYASGLANPRVTALLQGALAALPPCAGRAEVCGNGQDENCNALIDEGCSATGTMGAGGMSSGGMANGGSSTGGSTASGGLQSGPVPSQRAAGGRAPSAASRPVIPPAQSVPSVAALADEEPHSDPNCSCQGSGRGRLGSSGGGLVLAIGLRIGRRLRRSTAKC